jgi:hypothetical protein
MKDKQLAHALGVSVAAFQTERLYGKKSFVYPAFRRSFGYLNAGC